MLKPHKYTWGDILDLVWLGATLSGIWGSVIGVLVGGYFLLRTKAQWVFSARHSVGEVMGKAFIAFIAFGIAVLIGLSVWVIFL